MLKNKHFLVFAIFLMAVLYLPDVKVWTAAIIILFCLWLLRCVKSLAPIFAIACALIIILYNTLNPYGRLEAELDKPFYARLYITSTADKETFTQATAKILNKGNEKVFLKFEDDMVRAGDVLEVKNFELTCTEKEVNEKTEYYDRYLKSIGIRYIAYLDNEDFKIIEREHGFFFVKYARKFNEYIKETSDKVFINRETNAFIKGLLIGNKESFTEEELENFSLSGTSHIIAVSGFHIMVFVGIFTFITLRMNKKLRDLIIILFVLFMMFVTGCSASIVRAGVVVIIYTTMSYIGIDRDADTVLPLVATAFIFLNPYIIYNASFLLSFGATYGIVKCSQLVKKFLYFLPDFIGDSLSVTLSAQIGAFPAMLYCFGYTTLYSLFVNVIIALLVPVLFVIAPFCIVTGDRVFIFVCDVISEFILWLSDKTALIDYNKIVVGYNAFSFFIISLGILLFANLIERLNAVYELKKEVEHERTEEGYQE